MRSEESKDIKELLLLMSTKTYTSSYCDCGDTAHEVINRVSHLLALDHTVVELNNKGGRYSENYPCRILIPDAIRDDSIQWQQRFDLPSYKGPIKYAHYARCRKRFPVPVILFQGKYICRSSTIATVAEICSRIAASHINNVRNVEDATTTAKTADRMDYDIPDSVATQSITVDSSMLPEIPPDIRPEKDESQLTFSSRVSNFYRSHDIKLLKSLNVGTIVDLMVENKKVKYFLTVSSSEKIDKENRYSDFKIVPLPYPGCEFFAEYKKKNYVARGLHFNWNQMYVNATLDIPEQLSLDIPWTEYKTWDLLTLTQNYIKLLLNNLSDGDQSGILIHCISGWDRTPLFVSLLRLSLWADGLIHKSLDEHQILYLTLAYDWYLFGHNLPDRLSKGEVILFFCFNLLKYIEGRKFSLLSQSEQFSAVIHPEDNDNSTDGSFVLEFDDKEMDYLIHGGYSHEVVNGNDLIHHNQDSNSSSSFPENGNINASTSILGTSPVAVPLTDRSRRKTESISSVGSWQMVSACGSLRSPDFHMQNAKYLNKNANVSPISYASDTDLDALYRKRKERLDRVRALFLHCYCTTFDINHIPGIFESFFSDKVGLN